VAASPSPRGGACRLSCATRRRRAPLE
jgi:hypothetical protein